MTADMLRAGAGWGWHIETAIHVLRLILGGVFDKYLKLQIVIGHMGEALPFMLQRLDVMPMLSGLAYEPLPEGHETVRLDTLEVDNPDGRSGQAGPSGSACPVLLNRCVPSPLLWILSGRRIAKSGHNRQIFVHRLFQFGQ